MKVIEYLNEISAKQYHIFDSHQEKMSDQGFNHLDQDYDLYSYNIHKNNKPKPGDIFLYRRPGKSTSNRKFNIYGGGVIDFITKPDLNGNVVAKIKLPFRFITPLEQGTTFLENFNWTSKEKKPGSWEHFWNQYGMNLINEHDFYGLVGDRECVAPSNHNPYLSSIYEASHELDAIDAPFDISGFQVSVDQENESISPTATNTISLNGKHVNFNKVHASNMQLGKAGEYLVLEMLRSQYEGTGAIIEHTADLKGDGTGYDIKIITDDGKEIRIEVKTTTTSYVDGFYMTPRELNAARQCLLVEASKTKSYHIYRVYNFNPKNKSANIKIYDHFNDKDFRFEPTCWKVHIR